MATEPAIPSPSLRLDARDAPWPLRPWIMAAICAIAGLLFQWLASFNNSPGYTPARGALATAILIGTGAFVLTVEQRRWWWALAFAVGWGAVIGFVGLSTGRYGADPTLFEWPFFSGVVAVLIAAPLFQTARDEGGWRFPHMVAHGHAWGDAVIGAAGFVFVGIAFLLALLIAGLFNIIGISALMDLLQETWFEWLLAGFAFGAALGLMRERDALVATLQRLVMIVLGVLAPVLAVALVAFLASLPVAGLSGLWDGWISATALTLAAAAGAQLLLNSAIGQGDEAHPVHPVLRWSALALTLAVLPLAALALTALGLRIAQYGWTPERIWGVIAGGVAATYGLIGLWSVVRGRLNFDAILRPLQVQAALGVCGLALLLALPIVDFGAFAARDQLARLQAGTTPAAAFDWSAMAFDFGPEGRRLLRQIAAGRDPARSLPARAALAAENRYTVTTQRDTLTGDRDFAVNVRVSPAGAVIDPALRSAIIEANLCAVGPCRAQRLRADRWLLVGRRAPASEPDGLIVQRDAQGAWSELSLRWVGPRGRDADAAPTDLRVAPIQIRPVERQQVVVDGAMIGELPD